MKWFNDLRVAVKVLICCMIFIILLIAGALYAVRSINQTEKDIDIFYADRVKPEIWGNEIYKNVLQMRINMLVIQAASAQKNEKEIDVRIEDYFKRKAANEKLWKTYRELKRDKDETELAERFEKEYADMMGDFERMIKAGKSNNIREADAINVVWIEKYRKARDTMDEILKFQVTAGEKMIAVNRDNSVFTRTLLYFLLGFSACMGVIITIVLARSVSGPVNKGLAFARKIANGDFTDRIELDQKDELGQLGKALNTAADDLEKMVADIIVGSQNLTQVIQEISSGNENLSQRTTEQASSLEEVASTIEETTASINQNAENAREANMIAEKTTKMAEEGGRVVYGAVSAINEINEASKKIESIISVINEISFQTNLLALNAAVEAARAGEQGRGFAVVAGEVRNLAQRSGSAAKEIGELIKSTITKVEKGTTLANQSGEALKEIIGSVQMVGKFVSEINAASEEQKQGSAQINIAVSELDSMTQQNAGLVEETASASEEMANQAQELLGTMERFKIRQQHRNTSYTAGHRDIHLRAASRGSQVKTPKREITKHPGTDAGNGSNGSDAFIALRGKAGSDMENILSQDGFEQF